jgi:hypothetical protein
MVAAAGCGSRRREKVEVEEATVVMMEKGA